MPVPVAYAGMAGPQKFHQWPGGAAFPAKKLPMYSLASGNPGSISRKNLSIRRYESLSTRKM